MFEQYLIFQKFSISSSIGRQLNQISNIWLNGLRKLFANAYYRCLCLIWTIETKSFGNCFVTYQLCFLIVAPFEKRVDSTLYKKCMQKQNCQQCDVMQRKTRENSTITKKISRRFSVHHVHICSVVGKYT